jgi:hypothetical protein
MTVEVDVERQAVGISWDTDLVQGKVVTLKAENVANDDVSTRGEMPNDGHAVLTYPQNYHGSSLVTVRGSEEGEDTGTITV